MSGAVVLINISWLYFNTIVYLIQDPKVPHTYCKDIKVGDKKSILQVYGRKITVDSRLEEVKIVGIGLSAPSDSVPQINSLGEDVLCVKRLPLMEYGTDDNESTLCTWHGRS